MTLDKEFYTIKELCRLLLMSESTIYRLIRDGKLITHNFSRKNTRIRRDDLEEFLSRFRKEGRGQNED